MIESAKYSVLYNGFNLQNRLSEVEHLLKNGIKVFWFGSSTDASFLSDKFVIFKKYRLLQFYETKIKEQFIIIDGNFLQNQSLFDKLSDSIPDFNSGQYRVEHSRNKNIIVKASAGTGKTTVMIDRIMYLLHAEDANLSEIAMITFTNNATDQMGRRIQNELINRYEATRLRKYLGFIENLSSISISTIDSFSIALLKKFGIAKGYGKTISVSNHNLELKNIIRKMIEDEYRGSGSLEAQFGLDLNHIVSTVFDFYNRLSDLGIAPDGIDDCDWGAVEGESEKLQRILIRILKNINTELDAYKRENNTISLTDTVRNVNRILSSDFAGLPDFKIKYIFVDEFQDTNAGQIELVASLAEHLDASLFVVGDPKQSIYRFRGADNAAFDSFSEILRTRGAKRPAIFELVNNYRTDPLILNQLDCLFRQLIRKKLLTEFEPLHACISHTKPALEARHYQTEDELYEKLIHDTKKSLNELYTRIGNREPEESEKVVILVRYNREMKNIIENFDKNDIPIIAKREEPFYSCDAVSDFFTMISSHVFGSEPSIVFNYLVSPYSCLKETINLKELESLDGNREEVNLFLRKYLSQTEWNHYEEEFRVKPALSVIKNILNETPVIENYVARLKSKGVNNPAVLRTRAEKYRLNLDKLLTVLYNSVPRDGISLFRIYEFLRIYTVSNRSEQEADFEYNIRGPVVYCMTVHGAKGLEFDTVIIPSENSSSNKKRTEILISSDEKRVGWNFHLSKGPMLSNKNYAELKINDDKRENEEETRILYVAMTRAVRKLVYYVHTDTDDGYSWSNILDEVS